MLVLAPTDFGVRAPPGASELIVRRSGSSSEFNCRVAYVHDGDTFRCADGTRIRLSAIDTPEMPGACRTGRSCTPGDPYRAKSVLASMIEGRNVSCKPAGASYNRVAAWCSIGGTDLSCAMLKSGLAIRLPKYDPSGRLIRCRS
nr:thermonuclease family protein [Sphingomonas sp. LHG3406-1]